MAACVYPRFRERLRQLLHERMMGARFCSSLKSAGYAITPGRCAAIVSGEDLPQDARALIVAISKCLLLTPSEEDALTMAFGQDLLANNFGPGRMAVILQCEEGEEVGAS